MEKNEKVLKKYAQVVTSDTLPPPRFGHTVNLISKNTIVVFGGAIITPGNYTMTADLYIYRIQLNQWKKLETSQVGNFPHAKRPTPPPLSEKTNFSFTEGQSEMANTHRMTYGS